MLSTVDMTFSGKCIASVSVVLVSIMFVSAEHITRTSESSPHHLICSCPLPAEPENADHSSALHLQDELASLEENTAKSKKA